MSTMRNVVLGLAAVAAVSGALAAVAGTVAIQVVISAKRFSGSYNDGYIDNVSLNLSH